MLLLRFRGWDFDEERGGERRRGFGGWGGLSQKG